MVERRLRLRRKRCFRTRLRRRLAVAIIALAGIRERMRYSNVPAGLRGLGIAFLLTGLMAIGFLAFGGISCRLLRQVRR